MGPCDVASDVFTHPAESIHIDWYDGIVQAVLLHDDHGAWYAFAVPLRSLRDLGAADGVGPHERLLCMRLLVDRSVVPDVMDLETVDDQTWLTRLGTDHLIPACGPTGVLLRIGAGLAVLDARELLPHEIAALRPVDAQELYR